MSNVNKTAILNDVFRCGYFMILGKVVFSFYVCQLPEHDQKEIWRIVSSYVDFDTDTDPYGEHNFGSFTYQEVNYFWKIDYYNRDMSAGSEDPSDPEITTRVLTIMMADEY